MIDEGGLDRDDAPAAGSAAAPTRGATSVTGGRARSSGASFQAAAGPYTSTQITKLSSAGGLAARIARPVQTRALGEYSPDDALKVSTQAAEILFGRTRATVLRVGDIPLVKERQREYKSRSAQAKDLRSRGKAVPADFCPDTFFTFQRHCNTILAQAPISVRDVGQVTWMSSKWHVTGADDMTCESEFAQICKHLLAAPYAVRTGSDSASADYGLANPPRGLPTTLAPLRGRLREVRREDGGSWVAG